MEWRVVLGSHAEKQLRRIPARNARRVTDALARLSRDPFAGDLVKLAGQGSVWRLRVGAYRIILEFYEKERLLFVYEIVRRTSATY